MNLVVGTWLPAGLRVSPTAANLLGFMQSPNHVISRVSTEWSQKEKKIPRCSCQVSEAKMGKAVGDHRKAAGSQTVTGYNQSLQNSMSERTTRLLLLFFVWILIKTHQPKIFALLHLLNAEQQVGTSTLCEDGQCREQPNSVQTVQNPTVGDSLISAQCLVCVIDSGPRWFSQTASLPASVTLCEWGDAKWTKERIYMGFLSSILEEQKVCSPAVLKTEAQCLIFKLELVIIMQRCIQ